MFGAWASGYYPVLDKDGGQSLNEYLPNLSGFTCDKCDRSVQKVSTVCDNGWNIISLIPSMHLTLKQCITNVDATSGRYIGVDMTLFVGYILAEIENLNEIT